jgi:hypothetical protein
VDKNFYPKVDMYSATNMWWYDSSKPATPSNTLTVAKNGAEITAINFAAGGGKVMWIGTYASRQIWAKWTISQETLWKQYLSKDLFDPEISDIKVWTEKMIEKWIWRYVYAVYKKPLSDSWNENQEWTYYNIAYTIKKEWTDTFLTKIVWDYDSNSCFDNKNDCPATLIWSWNEYLVDWQEIWKKADWTNLADANVDQPNQWIPYPVQF